MLLASSFNLMASGGVGVAAVRVSAEESMALIEVIFTCPNRLLDYYPQEETILCRSGSGTSNAAPAAAHRRQPVGLPLTVTAQTWCRWITNVRKAMRSHVKFSRPVTCAHPC
jgi:hypothetical protein